MHALIERAYRLKTISTSQRTGFYKRFSNLGWRTHEPASDELAPEQPRLAAEIGQALIARGLSHSEAAVICGFAPDNLDNPFLAEAARLRLV